MNTHFKSNPIKLAGRFPVANEKAHDFTLTKSDLTEFNLRETRGKRTVLNIFPSLDTSTCAMSVRKFNEIASDLPETVVLCISRDLPFAQNRFCVAEDIKDAIVLSDFRYKSDFGERYGVMMTNGLLCGLLARAVIVIDKDGKILYSQLSSEITEEPDYQKAIEALIKNNVETL